jgi:adenine deaminase
MRSYMDIETSRTLVDTAMGRAPADFVIQNGRWVCVQSGEIIPETDVAIKRDRIAYVGPDASHTIGEHTQVIDADGRYLVPGLLDAHMHVESGMLTVTEFVRAILVRGTTAIFIDPHEIANVFGLQGVRLMVDEAAEQPIHVWVQMPSCVPSAPGFESAGASISPAEVAEAMTWDGIIGLGEMMNFPAVINSDEKMHAEMYETRRANKVIGGHYASPDLGLPFHGYVAGGPEDDHEGTRLEDGIARVRQGMKAMLRLGSAWHDVESQARAITEHGLDSRHFILCTDDSHSGTLVHEGHMDRVVRHAIDQGLPPMTAIQMATLNPAQHFGLSRELGQIAPGRFADIVLVDELEDFMAQLVIARGVLVAENGRCLVERKPYPYPDWAKKSVHVDRTLTAKDFRIPVEAPSQPAPSSNLVANIIGIIENQAPTRHLHKPVGTIGGEIIADTGQDIAKVALVERHQGTGNITLGLVHGFGFNQPCAVASTVAHDSHHMLVVGTNDSDMALAANELVRSGGGQIVVQNGRVIGLVELPIAGLMSSEPAEIVAGKAGQVLEGFRSCGCTINNPNMQLSLLALVVIPELRISDQGLVDVSNFNLIPLLENRLNESVSPKASGRD